MRRLLRVLALYWSTSIDAELEYRGNFVIALLASLSNLCGSAFTLYLFTHGAGQGTGAPTLPFPGWSFDESLVVLGLFTTLTGVSATFLVPNLNRIVMHVEQGTLDFVLLKPFDSQLQVSFRAVSPWGMPDIAAGVALLVYATTKLQLAPFDIVMALVPTLAGVAILYSIWFFTATTSLWFVRIYNATEVLRGLLDAGRFPVSAYPSAVRFFFTGVVPVAFLTTVPAEAALGRASPALALGSSALAIVLVIASRAFWRRALRSYTSASS